MSNRRDTREFWRLGVFARFFTALSFTRSSPYRIAFAFNTLYTQLFAHASKGSTLSHHYNGM